MTELEMLRQIAEKVIEGYKSDDLWVDGECGAARLREANEMAERWKRDYPEPPLHCGMPSCRVCNAQFI